MEIYGNYCEKTFRKNFSKHFEWINFNIELGKHLFQASSRKAIAINPSHVSKSGKHTQGIGQFWSGCAQAVKHGLEILGIGLIDIDLKDCVSLKAVQTPSPKSFAECGLSLPKWYLTSILANKEKLLGLSRHVVADSYFSVFEFVDGLTREGGSKGASVGTCGHLQRQGASERHVSWNKGGISAIVSRRVLLQVQ